jgi:probable F420-dependent oxidoreductase
MTIDIGAVGVWTPSTAWQVDEAVRAETVAELDELGYGALWLGASAGDLRLPKALLDATRRLVVATGIINVWTEPASLVSASYHQANAAHPDRLLLGFGSSHAPAVEAPVDGSPGQRYHRPLTRLARYLDELDSQQPAMPRDRRVLAALGPRTLALAAQRTAGAHPYLVTPEHTRAARQIMGPNALLAPEQKIVLNGDPAAARATARTALQPYLRLPNYTRNLLRLGFTEQDLSGSGSDRLVDALVAWSEPQTVSARVREHLDAGADHVSVQVISASGRSQLAGPQWRALAEPLGLGTRAAR